MTYKYDQTAADRARAVEQTADSRQQTADSRDRPTDLREGGSFFILSREERGERRQEREVTEIFFSRRESSVGFPNERESVR